MSRSVGSGKYEDLCCYVLKKSKGKVAVVVVVDGAHGTGMAVKEEFVLMGGQYHLRKLPKFLRKIAEEIEKSLKL